MLWLLKVLILGKWCDHVWEVRERGAVVSALTKNQIGSYANCQCEKCGKWKTFET